MNNSVFILFGEYLYEGATVLGVYATEDVASAALAVHLATNENELPSFDSLYVREQPVLTA